MKTNQTFTECGFPVDRLAIFVGLKKDKVVLKYILYALWVNWNTAYNEF